MVSISIPKNVRHVVGPSRLFDAMGNPRMLHNAISKSRLAWHSSERGLPAVMKSSR